MLTVATCDTKTPTIIASNTTGPVWKLFSLLLLLLLVVSVNSIHLVESFPALIVPPTPVIVVLNGLVIASAQKVRQCPRSEDNQSGLTLLPVQLTCSSSQELPKGNQVPDTIPSGKTKQLLLGLKSEPFSLLPSFTSMDSL